LRIASGGFMTDNSFPTQGSAVPGDPLLGGIPNVGKFEVDFASERYYYPAASHRPVFKWIEVKNTGWTGDDEIIVSISSEATGAQALIHPVLKAYPAIQPGETLPVEVLAVRPNFNELAQLEESLIGNLVVQVRVNEQVVAEKRTRIEFLAYNQWMHDAYDYDCLSAFVFPNHPIVVKIMDDVRKRLLKDTQSGITSGYQPFFSDGPQVGIGRNREVMKAIYEELQSLGLEYSDPPQSFEGFGQKIRTPDIALRDRVVTCLDSTVLAASCIAAAGLDPILFVVRGHAFPGVWSTPGNALTDSGGPRQNPARVAVVTNINDFQAMSTLQMIMSFESTNVCRSIAAPFEAAENRHQDFANGPGADKFQALIDVSRSAELGVRRLPNRTLIAGTHEYEITVDRSAFDVSGSTPEFEFDAPSSDQIQRDKLSVGDVPRRVRRWMDALLDISNTNPLINLATREVFLPQKATRGGKGINLPLASGQLASLENRLMAGSDVRVVCAHKLPSHVLQSPSDENIREYFEDSGCLSMASPVQAANEIAAAQQHLESEGLSPQMALVRAQGAFEKVHEAEATRRFRALKKLADDVEADSATNQLFLTIGTMAWESPGEAGKAARPVRSPLFVVPVRLGGNAASGFTITLDSGGEITPNYCLVEKLRSELGLRIPELETPDLDESGIDVGRTISAIRRQLSESRYSTIRVDEEAQLAVLDFATFRMWKDVQSNWQLFTKNPVVNHLINGSNATLDQPSTQFMGEALTPFSCDESQMEAVQWALEGKSFVLEGPPGTGKSQTIANLIASCLAEGKRILFVAEKQVALEAVSSKLEEIGLDPFCITMHHESTTPESIRRQLQVSLDFVGQDVSRQWQSDSLLVNSLKDRLVKYRDSLVEENALGWSAVEAQREVLRLGEGKILSIDPTSFPLVGQYLEAIQSALLQILGVVGNSTVVSDPFWDLSNTSSMETFDRDLFARVVGQIRDVMEQHPRLQPIIESLFEATFVGGVPTSLADAINLVADGKHLGVDVSNAVLAGEWAVGIENLIGQINSCKTLNSDVFAFFDTSAFKIDLSPQMNAASEAVSAGLFKRSRRAEILKDLLKPIVKSDVEKEPSELLTLLQKVAPVKVQMDQLTASLRAVPHLSIRPDFDPFVAEHLDEIRSSVQDLQSRARIFMVPEAVPVRTMVQNGQILQRTDIQIIELILTSWTHVRNILSATPESIAKWRRGRSLWESLLSSIPVWSEATPQYAYLSRSALILETLAPLYSGGLSDLANRILSGEQGLDDIYNQFMRGLAHSARSERLAAGALSSFDASAFDMALAQFTRQEAARRELMWQVIPRQLSESRPFKPGVRTGEIGNLERELARRVRRVSVSQLIKNYGEMITRLAPCFLMSPEAVSRLLPAESQFFDIVVFDEASQIRVAAAIPAMGRAKAAIVVGDSQQMPPSKKIGQRQVSTENDAVLEDDEVSQDLESILSECTESNVPSLMLKCHFRSQHEGLIAFSNRNFYDSNLVTFPAPNTDKTTPVAWFDVPDGQFIRSGEGKGTNPAEAKTIVAEIIRRVEDPIHAGKSIGVVTFNEVQTDCIQEMLDTAAASHPALSRALNHAKKKERLFVVPLERVQGDERDTIILSVSYSYQNNNRQSVSPTWGPLTHKGGEKRLNVAITRAKQDLLVFCSFDPNHVSSDGSKHDGVPFTTAFLKECRDASRSNGVALRARDASSLDYHRRLLFDLLRNEGIQVRENVGLSKFRIDLAITDQKYNNQFLSILLDGEEWTKRSTPFDRDVLPNSVMRLIGWRRIGRVWLKDAVANPNAVVTLVKNELQREQMRHELIQMLTENNYEVRSDARLSQVGIDIAIREPGQSMWPLAISLNGPQLFKQFYSYEGDVPPEKILRDAQCFEGLSLWLPDLNSGPEMSLESIKTAFRRASDVMSQFVIEEEEIAQAPLTVAEQMKAQEASAGILLAASPMRSDFLDSRVLPALGDQSILGPGAGEDLALVRRAANEIIEFEGPIAEERLAKVLVARFGMSAVRGKRLESLQLQFAGFTKSVSPFGTVYWSSTREPNLWRGFRTSTEDGSRTIDEIPAEEIVNAMVAVVEMNPCFEEEIIRNTAEAFGRKVLTKVLNERLGAILNWAVQQGKIKVEANLYKVTN
jgi:hypothetical protein